MAFPKRPATHRAPRGVRVPQRRRAFERAGRTQRPLAGPEIPIPADQDEQLMAEWKAWQQKYHGSLPEFLVWRWLIYKKKVKENVDFFYQWPLYGGRTYYGGFVLDFLIPARDLGWRVQGLRWHLLRPSDRARDYLAKIQLEHQGIHVVDLWEDDILNRREYTLEHAWNGREVNPRRGR